MKRGYVICWVVIDPHTGELVLRCPSRSEARRIAIEAGARYAKVVLQ